MKLEFKGKELSFARLARMQRMFEAQPLRVFCLQDLGINSELNVVYLERMIEAKIIEEVPLLLKFGHYGQRRQIRGWRLRKK
jgi:hypothetical protein